MCVYIGTVYVIRTINKTIASRCTRLESAVGREKGAQYIYIILLLLL